ncbi:unnamed protein product [Ophioblennius macclurei]
MDGKGFRNEEAESLWQVKQKTADGTDSWRLVEVFLSGGAPWGFTLRGGLEHREPLLVTKVEEGSKAAAVSLQVGDELVNINEIPLSGFRQEAICLVKGSHKTLSLVVKRRNEPKNRPHSWHAAKFNDSQSEMAKMHSPPMAVWHTGYDASSSSTDLSAGWEQTNLRRASNQFSSLGSMDSLDHASPPYAKSNNSMEHLGGGKRDSAYSSFSTSSGTPDYTLSRSTENMLHKVGQWDATAKHSNGRYVQNAAADTARQDERLTYFQIPWVSAVGEGQQVDDLAGNRHSTSSRTSFGPVWNVPERKKTASPSPPPPLPPARSDSFAATKVHEKGMVMPQPEGSDPFKGPSDAVRGHHESFNSSFVKSVHNKQYSLSSADVCQAPPPTASQAHHQWQHSDKSISYPQPWTASAPRPHNTGGGYYCSLQELPSNGSVQHPNENQRRNLSSALSSTAADQNTDGSGQSRYYCVTTCAAGESVQTGNEQTSFGPPAAAKAKYNVSQQHQGTTSSKTSVPKLNADARGHGDAPYISRLSEQRRSLPLQHRDPTPRDGRPHVQVANKICPQATPMLHSLSVDAADQDQRARGSASDDYLDSNQAKRSERFATTLRNEIQMRRARLQKSKSAAAIPGADGEVQEDQDVWKFAQHAAPPPSDSTFSNAYKDHLKEAQARVLKATSFRRRDLEPVLQEHATAEATPNYPRSKDVMPLPTVTELATGHPSQVTRIGGRKRFPAEKKVKSFSEPDKIHKVGTKDKSSSSLDQQEIFPEHQKASFAQKQSNHHDRDPSSIGTPVGVAKGVVVGRERDPLVQDQQRLGTFAEYEAKWSVQKKASGRYRSADNILDTGPEGRGQSFSCFHERSRSSPSADLYAQNVPVPAPPSQRGNKPAEPLNGNASGQPGDCRITEQPAEFEHHPPPPQHPDCRLRGSPAVAERCESPPPAPHGPAEADNCGGPRKKPPRPRCPEVASCQSDALVHCPPHADPSSSLGPAHSEQQAKGQGAGRRSSASGPPSASTYVPAAPPASMEEQRRSPSPHFSPQRLSDKPPEPPLLHSEDAARTEKVSDSLNTVAKKVPIRIVHSDRSDKDCRPFLQHGDAPAPAEGQGSAALSSLGAASQDSVFCAFTRQCEPGNAPQTDMDQESSGGAQQVEEEQKREELTRDIVDKDKSLADILDQSKMKTTMDLMEGIFPRGEQLLEGAQQRRKVQTKQSNPRPAFDSVAAAVTMVTSSTYYSTSAPKAELLIKMKDMQEQQQEVEEEVEEEEDDDDLDDELDVDLSNKKQELMDSLSRKLQVLRDARLSLQEDVVDNNALGEEVEAQVQQVCKPNELDKFRMFVGDLDKVVSLLLSLSGRLARVENAINSLEDNAAAEERRTLVEKRKLLTRQHEDAKELKENLDRRERLVYDILASYLPAERLTDYEHFVKMKSALIIEQRKLEDKIKLGEEQLKCLMDSLPLQHRLNI